MNRFNKIIILILLLSLNDGISPSNIKQSKRQVKQVSTSKCVCGIENTSTRLERIIDGAEIKPELRFPWLLPLVYRNGTFFCGGTLINSRYIMTSAHCFKFSKKDASGELRFMISSDAIIVPERITSNMLVGIGVHNLLNDHQPPSNLAERNAKIQPNWQSIDYAIIHRFYENFETAIRHDIALIRLRKEIDFDNFKWLRPICLPDSDEFELEPFNKFQLDEYVQPNIIELNSNQISSNSLSNSNSFTNLLHNHASNGTSVYSSMFNDNSYLLNNETIKSIERINSKRLKLDKLLVNDRRRRDLSRENVNESNDENNGYFFSAGWGQTERNIRKLSKLPLWMQLKMLSREQCIEKNGERVKWNFICAEGIDKEQETAVGDSGGPLFGQIKRKVPNRRMKIKPAAQPINLINQNHKNLTSTVKPTTIRLSSTTAKSTITTTTTSTTATTETTTTTEANTTPKSITTTEKSIIMKYMTKPPIQTFKWSKRPQKPLRQQQTTNDMNSLLTKVKENTNRHFFSAMIYEDLFKTLNLPHDDLNKLATKEEEEDEKETRDLIDGEDSEKDDKKNAEQPNKLTTEKPFSNESSSNSIDIELDLSKNNYVQLGITSWSSYLNPEIGMYTDVRAYLGWIKRNTQDANYCLTDPLKINDDKIPLPTSKPDLPDPITNLNCGAEKLKGIDYPWLVSLFENDKFLGNCVYFYSNFIICSDIYAEQTYVDINQIVNRFNVQFYYPNRKFKVKNIVNKLLSPTTTTNRREYLIVQLDDPNNQLHRTDLPKLKINRASIDAQINKNNAQATCLSTRDYPLNEESSNLVTFYLFAPGENLIRTQLKLTSYRKCRQLAPNYVTRRFLCAQIGSSEEISIPDHFKKQIYPNRDLTSPPATSTSNTTSFASKLKNFFRLQSGIFQNHYYSNLLKDYPPMLDSARLESKFEVEEKLNDRNESTLFKKNRALFESNNFKELLDGQPVFHKIDEQYTLVGFLVKAPFPTTLVFRNSKLILMLDLKKFRFQIVTKLMKSLRSK